MQEALPTQVGVTGTGGGCKATAHDATERLRSAIAEVGPHLDPQGDRLAPMVGAGQCPISAMR
jgi:hypothetical protein